MTILFDKHFKNNDYEIFFNSKVGLEIMRGVNGKDDPFVLEMPSLLDIGVMGTCKHRCEFCYQGHVDRPNMKVSDFKRIIDEASYHVNQVALGGRGDPNHHENFGEMIEYCRSKNVVPNYTTSGIGLTQEHIEISKMCGAVAVSDYGQAFTYQAIQSFIDSGIKTNIHQIFSHKSFEKCCELVMGKVPSEWAFDHDKLNAVIFLLFKPHGAGKTLKDYRVSDREFEIFSNIIFEPKSNFKVGMDSCLVNHVLKYGTPTELQRQSIDTCEGARMSAYITPDMHFMPCSFADRNVWATPITSSNTLKKIWDEAGAFTKFRTILEKDACCPLAL